MAYGPAAHATRIRKEAEAAAASFLFLMRRGRLASDWRALLRTVVARPLGGRLKAIVKRSSFARAASDDGRRFATPRREPRALNCSGRGEIVLALTREKEVHRYRALSQRSRLLSLWRRAGARQVRITPLRTARGPLTQSVQRWTLGPPVRGFTRALVGVRR
jgi:hypothetical protein